MQITRPTGLGKRDFAGFDLACRLHTVPTIPRKVGVEGLRKLQALGFRASSRRSTEMGMCLYKSSAVRE